MRVCCNISIQKFKRHYILFVLLCFSSTLSFSQSDDEFQYPYTSKIPEGYRVTACIINDDTVPCIWMPWITVQERMPFHTRQRYAQWTRLKYNVKMVYPYAIIAAAKLKQYDIELAKISDECKRKKYLKQCEKDLQNQFSNELKELSINQGKILMKLIDRETGKTTYTIVKEMRGGFEAAMWQSLAVIFGSSMKQEYDLADENDKLIELAVKQVEAGEF